MTVSHQGFDAAEFARKHGFACDDGYVAWYVKNAFDKAFEAGQVAERERATLTEIVDSAVA